jgi:hypothetical protein
MIARVLAVLAVLGAHGLAGAEERPEASGGDDLRFALEGALGIGAVAHDRTFAAFELVQRVHIGFRLPWGLQGGLAMQHAGALGGDVDDSAELFFLGPEVRFHPLPDHCVDPWLGIAGGIGILDEENDSPYRRESWNGGVLQVTAGVLFAVSERIAIGGWAGATFGLWEQNCILAYPYQLEHCMGHESAIVYGLGASIAPRFAPPR